MTIALGTTTALLVELLRGPGYGLELIGRVRTRCGGRLELRQGAVYPALRELLRRGWVRSWRVAPSGSGRPRTYHELTPEGTVVAQAQREMFSRLVAPKAPVRPTPNELKRMRRRLFECGALTEAALWLRQAGKAPRK